MHTTHPTPTPFIPALHQHLAQWPRLTSWQDAKGNTYYTKPDLLASQAEKALWKLGDDADRYHRAKVLRADHRCLDSVIFELDDLLNQLS